MTSRFASCPAFSKPPPLTPGTPLAPRPVDPSSERPQTPPRAATRDGTPPGPEPVHGGFELAGAGLVTDTVSRRRKEGSAGPLVCFGPTSPKLVSRLRSIKTDARCDIPGRNRLLFGRSPVGRGHTPGQTGRRRAAILMPAPSWSTISWLSGRRVRSTWGARTGSLAEGTAEAGQPRPGHRVRRGRPGRQVRSRLEEPRVVRRRRRVGRRLVKNLVRTPTGVVS
jgi:hypothetical protein